MADSSIPAAPIASGSSSSPTSEAAGEQTGVKPKAAPRPVTLELIAQASAAYVTPHLANPATLEKAMRDVLRKVHHPLSVVVHTVSRQTDVLAFSSCEGVTSAETQRLARSFFDAIATPDVDADGCVVSRSQQLRLRRALFSVREEGPTIHRLMLGDKCVLDGVRVEPPSPPQVDEDEDEVVGTLETVCLRTMAITVKSERKRETFNVQMKKMTEKQIDALKDSLIYHHRKNLPFAVLARTDKRRLVDGLRLGSVLASLEPESRPTTTESTAKA